MNGGTILIADDYALTAGVIAAIDELALALALSGTSAMVTTPHWAASTQRVGQLWQRCAVGLHVNLTLGKPLGPLPRLAPQGQFPTIGTITRSALLRQLDRAEIQAEIARQLKHFHEVAGFWPDFIDGHQHVHALPVVRDALLGALKVEPALVGVLIRDPSDRPDRIVRRGVAVPKSLVLAGLAQGFGSAARRAGFLTNRGFSGVSDFSTQGDIAAEFARFFAQPGPRHLVMCHPGHVDDELRSLDPVVERREREFRLLGKSMKSALSRQVWQASRDPQGRVIWPGIAP